MTSGIGNPDWQRRYAFSAVPIFSQSFSAAGTTTSAPVDANGYTYISVTSQAGGTTSFTHITLNWYQDAAGTVLMGGTDWVPVPGTSQTVKVPAQARYFRVITLNVGGGTTGTILITAFGTSADQYEPMTGATSVPMISINGSLASGATGTQAAIQMLGGRVMLTMNHGTNNKYTTWLEYYDWGLMAWVIFYNVHGTDKGMAWTEQVWLPFAPVRGNIRNDDTVAQTCQLYMITADTP